eukprot:1846298-Rhodomonas_salina.2
MSQFVLAYPTFGTVTADDKSRLLGTNTCAAARVLSASSAVSALQVGTPVQIFVHASRTSYDGMVQGLWPGRW